MDDILGVFKESLTVQLAWSDGAHLEQREFIQRYQFFFQVGVFFIVDLLLDFHQFFRSLGFFMVVHRFINLHIFLNLISIFTIRIFFLFRVDDELFKSKQHTHLFFVHFCLHNILQQDQPVKTLSEPSATEENT